MTLTIDDVLHMIQQRIDALDDTSIYYNMREYRFKNIFPQTVSLVKICIAIDSLGLPINTSIVRPFMNKHDDWSLLDEWYRKRGKQPKIFYVVDHLI